MSDPDHALAAASASRLVGKLQDGELRLDFLKYGVHETNKVPTYYFRMVHAGTGEEVGNINLRIGSSLHIERYAGHIGFGVHPAHRGRRYAARSTRLLIPLARELKLDPLWITCDPENLASRRSCELAGAEFVEVVNVPEDCLIFRNGHPRKCRYRLDLMPLMTFQV